MARNKYAGTCYRCGLTVEPGTGHFERRNGRWRVQHAYFDKHGGVTCETAKRKADAAALRALSDFARDNAIH